jgi:hypothetical protein
MDLFCWFEFMFFLLFDVTCGMVAIFFPQVQTVSLSALSIWLV